MVQSLLSLPDNVPAIMRTLEMRYGHPDQIVQSFIAKAKSFTLIAENSLTGLMDFAISVNNLVTTIKTVNVPAHLQKPQLWADLADRLPMSLRLQLENEFLQLVLNLFHWHILLSG